MNKCDWRRHKPNIFYRIEHAIIENYLETLQRKYACIYYTVQVVPRYLKVHCYSVEISSSNQATDEAVFTTLEFSAQL